MALYDLTGRISIDYLFMDDGTPIIPGSMLTLDGELLFELIDHTVAVYALSSNLQSKALVGTYISYYVKLECTNNADPGKQLVTSINIPSGFDVVNAYTPEGIYNESTGKWSVNLNSDQEAYLYFIVDVIDDGTQEQIATLDGTIETITSTCTTSTNDSDGGIALREVDLQDYPLTLANMQDGKVYTMISYSRIYEPSVEGIHDGVKNGRLCVVNGNIVNNLAFINFATGTDTYKNSTGYSVSDEGVSFTSSTDMAVNGSRCLKIICDGSVTNQGAFFQASKMNVVTPGIVYTAKKSINGLSGSIRGHLAWYNSGGSFISSNVTNAVTLDGHLKTLTISATAPATAAYCSFVALTNSTGSTTTFYEDETIIVEGSSIPTGNIDMVTGDIITSGHVNYGTRATIQSNIQKQVCSFVYDSAEDLYIRQFDEYYTVTTSTINRWYGLCLNEGFNADYSESTNLLSDPEALFDDTGSTDLTLPGNSESAEYVYEIASATTLSGQFFTGILLNLNSYGMVASGIQSQITTDEVESEIKSTFISSTGQISLGDMADMWGLNEQDIQGETVYLHLIIRNTTLNEQSFSYSNLLAVLYYADNEIGDSHSIIYNGLHGKNYGIGLSNDANNEGPQFNLETLKLSMMDGELPIRFNIESKELEIDFPIHGDTIEESQAKVRAISNWLSNDRGIMGRPTLNSLIFTYDLTREYFVVFKDVIEVEKNVTSLLCTAKFLVPDGVARSTEPVITGPVGSNPGKIRVWPLIEVKTDGSSTLTITDNETSNVITLNSSPAENTTLYVDCEARTITDDAGTDYTTNLALNTVWINFLKEYSISVTGGVLQQVSYYPGY